MALKVLANILMKHLTGLGDNWPLYCKPAMLSYNSYATPNLDNLSPFEMEEKPYWPLSLNASLEYPSLVSMKKPKKSYRKNWLISGKDLKILGPIEWL